MDQCLGSGFELRVSGELQTQVRPKLTYDDDRTARKSLSDGSASIRRKKL